MTSTSVVSVLWCRHQCVVAVTSGQQQAQAGATGVISDDAVTAACWVGARGDCFATGHESGLVRVWGIPDAAACEGAAL